MSKRTLKDVEKDKENINKLHAELGEGRLS